MMYHRIPKVPGYTRKEVLSFFRMMLKTNKQWIMRGLLVVFNNQSEKERRDKGAFEHDGVGFDKVDAPIMNQIAREYLCYDNIPRSYQQKLTRRLARYAAQIAALMSTDKIVKPLDEYYKDRPRKTRLTNKAKNIIINEVTDFLGKTDTAKIDISKPIGELLYQPSLF